MVRVKNLKMPRFRKELECAVDGNTECKISACPKIERKKQQHTKSVGFWVSHTAVIHLRVYCAIYTFIAVVL